MARKRTIILIKSADAAGSADGTANGTDAEDPAQRPRRSGIGGGIGGEGSGAMLPMGTCDEIIATMASHNISPDGSGQEGRGESLGMATLYGPGFIVEIPTGGGRDQELSQAMVTLTDEDFAWPVLSRLCKIQRWRMMDPDSGRTFG